MKTPVRGHRIPSALLLTVGALIAAGGLWGCADDDEPEGDCTIDCANMTGGAPVDLCAIVDGEEACVLSCTNDSDCDSDFYPGCGGIADSGARYCGAASAAADAGADSAGADGGVGDAGVCVLDCAESTGGPPVDTCLIVGGDEACVLVCVTDNDCDDDFHTGCTSSSDNGRQFCELQS